MYYIQILISEVLKTKMLNLYSGECEHMCVMERETSFLNKTSKVKNFLKSTLNLPN